MNIEQIIHDSSTLSQAAHDGQLSHHLSKIVVGEITTIDTILQKTGLKAVMVNCGSEVLTTTCSADNLRVGMKTAFAKLGALLNNHRYVQIKEINGVECQGVICSEYDLGIGQEVDVVLEIPDETVNGTKLIDLVA